MPAARAATARGAVAVAVAAAGAGGDHGDVVGVVGCSGDLLGEADRDRGDVHRVEVGGELDDHRADGVEVRPVERVVDLAEQPGRQCVTGAGQPGGAQVRGRRDRGDLDGLTGQPLDLAQHVGLRRRHERDRHALAPGPADAPDAVHVGLGRLRHVVVDDVREQVDVQAAGGHVRGDQQLGAAAAQPLDDAGAVLLVHAAVQRLGAQAAARQRLGDGVDVEPGAAEHDGRLGPLGLQHAAQRGGGVGARDEVRGLAHQGRLTRGHLLAAHPHGDRLAQVVPREVLDAARHRRGEQHALAGVRGGVEEGLDVLHEAHVEHLVGLVEHDDVELVEPQRAAVHEVDRPAGGGHDDVDALGQAAQLRAGGGTAVDGEDARAHAPAVLRDRLGDLQRELAGRGEDETERRCAAGAHGALLAEALQHGQREGGGLAGAGGGLADQVAAFDQRRDGLGLDRGGNRVAERGDGPLQLGAEREVGEGRARRSVGLGDVGLGDVDLGDVDLRDGALGQGRVNDNVVQCHVCLSSNGTGARTVHPRAKPADVMALGRTAGFLDS